MLKSNIYCTWMHLVVSSSFHEHGEIRASYHQFSVNWRRVGQDYESCTSLHLPGPSRQPRRGRDHQLPVHPHQQLPLLWNGRGSGLPHCQGEANERENQGHKEFFSGLWQHRLLSVKKPGCWWSCWLASGSDRHFCRRRVSWGRKFS